MKTDGWMDANNNSGNSYFNRESVYKYISLTVPRNIAFFIVPLSTATRELHNKSNTNISSPHNTVRASTTLPKPGWRLQHRTNRFLPSVT